KVQQMLRARSRVPLFALGISLQCAGNKRLDDEGLSTEEIEIEHSLDRRMVELHQRSRRLGKWFGVVVELRLGERDRHLLKQHGVRAAIHGVPVVVSQYPGDEVAATERRATCARTARRNRFASR